MHASVSSHFRPSSTSGSKNECVRQADRGLLDPRRRSPKWLLERLSSFRGETAIVANLSNSFVRPQPASSVLSAAEQNRRVLSPGRLPVGIIRAIFFPIRAFLASRLALAAERLALR
jgi:hypothetical protein